MKIKNILEQFAKENNVPKENVVDFIDGLEQPKSLMELVETPDDLKVHFDDLSELEVNLRTYIESLEPAEGTVVNSKDLYGNILDDLYYMLLQNGEDFLYEELKTKVKDVSEIAFEDYATNIDLSLLNADIVDEYKSTLEVRNEVLKSKFGSVTV